MQLKIKLLILIVAGLLLCNPVLADGEDYTLYTRLGASFLTLDGDVARESSRPGNPFSNDIDLDDDLGTDDFSAGLFGEFNIRRGKHDLWLQGQSWTTDNNSTPSRSISIGDISFPVAANIESENSFDFIYGRYGYAFKTVANNGYRLGVNLTLGYASLDVDLLDTSTGRNTGVDAESFYPGAGIHFEKPFRLLPDTTLESSISGIYVNFDNFEGWVVDAYAGLNWRPHRSWGAFIGFDYDRINLDINDYSGDVTFWGMTAGVEYRF